MPALPTIGGEGIMFFGHPYGRPLSVLNLFAYRVRAVLKKALHDNTFFQPRPANTGRVQTSVHTTRVDGPWTRGSKMTTVFTARVHGWRFFDTREHGPWTWAPVHNYPCRRPVNKGSVYTGLKGGVPFPVNDRLTGIISGSSSVRDVLWRS